ncbi:cytochrome P450 1 sub A member 2 [Clonorchis sinensis]|uniref:Cytochrome P450 1A1 n=2 Tax=Clonorchis sinensis TaxID=79923 RepID=G7YSD2_CLOSI|nr:cytochrome P450 1 sub A member 2 [Clonorchis sinensis]GAA55862.1 cytochrome P450 1A1 [Clonorchis sinensis]
MWLQSLCDHLPEAAIAVLVCYGIFVFIRHLFELRCLPPGPYGLPWIGYTPAFGPSAFHQLDILHKSFGDVVCFKAFGNTVVVFNSYETLYEAAVVNRRKVGRWTLSVNDWLAQGHGISNYNTPRAVELRHALFRHLYGHENMIAYLSDRSENNMLAAPIRKEINGLIRELENSNQRPIKVMPIIRRTIWKIMWRVVFGTVCEMENEEIEHILQQISCNNMENTMFQASQLLPKCILPTFKYFPYIQRFFNVDRLTERYKIIHCTMQQEITKSMAAELNPESLLYRFTKDDKLKLTAKELHRLAFELMAAGSDTSSLTLTWAFTYLAAHPEQSSDTVTTKIMDAIHRYASVVPFGLPHIAQEAMTVAGFHIPRRSMLIFNLYAVHQKQRSTAGNVTPPIPFSLGARSCPGGRFANKLLLDIIQSVSNRFNIEAIKEDNIPHPVTRGLTRGPAENYFVFHPKMAL